MKKYVFIIALFGLACTQSYSDYSNITVTEVIDGDTIKLANGKLLRYIGIDTPETRIKKNGKFLYSPQPFSLEATQFNKDLVEGKSVKIEFDVEKVDKYGRLLGYCFVNDTFVNAKMLEEGYAVLYSRPPNVKYTDLFVTVQRQAQSNQKGLWVVYAIIDHAQANQYINQIRTVQGKVINTYKSPKCIFLNFGNDYRTDFTVVIFTNSLDSFYRKGIKPQDFYRGKTIRVSGRIRQYNGPEIIVNDPSQIEVIE